MLKAVKISIVGRVQGVGFRPFIYQLANDLDVKGTVQNNMDGVEVIVEGTDAQIKQFIDQIEHRAPRLSRVDKVVVHEQLLTGMSDFSIIKSRKDGASQLVIPVDAAICADCRSEMNDKNNFRYRYPFITCTQCGPRYTIIDALPYDRPLTTMSDFKLCPTCQLEYEDPLNRRHHAQPIACPNCGPQLSIVTGEGTVVGECDEALKLAGQFLQDGKVLAVKGIGGFHLCCDAENEQAVHTLRARKNRPMRPLAVMSSSLEDVQQYAEITKEEQNLLKSVEAPIVVLTKKETSKLAKNVAPNMSTIGVMLPYSPLHELLLQVAGNRTLVMTSANISGLPIVYKNDECLQAMGDIADYVLLHNRDICHPVDDSVVQVINGETDFFRKSRGYVPDALFTSKKVDGIVAFGGQQKTTFTLGRNEQVFIGPHIGDLHNLNSISHYKNELNHLLKWLQPNKDIAVIDCHPNYETREIIKEYNFKTTIEVQHHHAHMAACLADNEIDDESFAIILDGTGFGLDGNVWGFELFYGDCKHFKRLAHLQYSALPGGEACIREPWRNAVGMLISLLGDEGVKLSEQIFPKRSKAIPVLQAMIEKNMNTVYGGTCGRLFDAVSSIVGLCETSTYDGEAAISLSEVAEIHLDVTPYHYEIQQNGHMLTFDFREMLRQIANDVLQKKDVKLISTAFHETVVQALIEAMRRLQQSYPHFNKNIVLSGGSFHNRYLKERLVNELSVLGFEVLTHRRIPCNDGGLSYGQLMVAAAKREELTCV